MRERSFWSDQRCRCWSRRETLAKAALDGVPPDLLGLESRSVAAEPPPETTRLKIADLARGGICVAPEYVAKELLRGEGFHRAAVRQEGKTQDDHLRAVAAGEAQMIVTFVSSLVSRLDAGDPLRFLAGSHVGCLELFGTERVRAIRDLRGRTVAITENGIRLNTSSCRWFWPTWVSIRVATFRAAFRTQQQRRSSCWQQGRLMPFLGFPPVPQKLRVQKESVTPILNSATWIGRGPNTSAA